MSARLQVSDGTFRYPGAPAPILEHIDVEVGNRELLAVLGPNGAGKTTLLRTMLGLQRWETGATLLDGIDLASLSPREVGRRIAYVPQTRNSNATGLTGLDMVMLGRSPHLPLLAQPGQRERVMAEEALAGIGAEALALMPCRTMSGGQFQMVLIARALVAEPEVLVLDEPETGLDFHNQLIVVDLLRTLVHDRGLSIIMNTHYPAHALSVADRVLLLDSRHRAVSGPTREIMDEATLARVFDVEVCIGRLDHRGESLTTVVPVRALRPDAGSAADAGSASDAGT